VHEASHRYGTVATLREIKNISQALSERRHFSGLVASHVFLYLAISHQVETMFRFRGNCSLKSTEISSESRKSASEFDKDISLLG
jgi:hypothetical protein